MRIFPLYTLSLLAACQTEADSVQVIPVESTQETNVEIYESLVSYLQVDGATDREILLFLQALRPDGPIGATAYSVTQDFQNDGVSYAAIAIFDGVPQDDSVSGYRYDFEITQRDDRTLEIISAQESWRCWEGRGHQYFSVEFCS